MFFVLRSSFFVLRSCSYSCDSAQHFLHRSIVYLLNTIFLFAIEGAVISSNVEEADHYGAAVLGTLILFSCAICTLHIYQFIVLSKVKAQAAQDFGERKIVEAELARQQEQVGKHVNLVVSQRLVNRFHEKVGKFMFTHRKVGGGG